MGILDQILSWADNKRRVAGRNVKDALENPADFTDMVAGRIAAQNKKLASGDVEAVLDTVDITGGAAGMIRRGGRPDLNMTHETTVSNLLNILTGRRSITNPSIAISSNEVAPFMGLHDKAASLIMNPGASHYFDPAKNKMAQLANRDIYTTLQKEMLPADFRAANPQSLRLTEGVQSRDIRDFLRADPPIQDTQHMLSILGSEEFSSLAKYERARNGARVLDKKQGISEDATKSALREHFPDILDALYGSQTKLLDAQFTLDAFKKAAKAGNKESQKLFDILGSTHSDYAELKLPGELPVSPNTVSAILMSPLADPAQLRAVARAAEKQGIRAGRAEDVMPADMRSTYDDLALATLEQIKKGLSIPNSYFSALERQMLKEGSGPATEEMAKTFMKESSRYAADAASILTARDLDLAFPKGIK